MEKNKKKAKFGFEIIMASIIILIVICVVAIKIMDYYIDQDRAKKYNVYYQTASSYLNTIEDIESYKITKEHVSMVISDTWFNSTEKEKEDFCCTIRDSVTVLRNNEGLEDGYYVIVYFYDNNNQAIATAHLDGTIEIFK